MSAPFWATPEGAELLGRLAVATAPSALFVAPGEVVGRIATSEFPVVARDLDVLRGMVKDAEDPAGVAETYDRLAQKSWAAPEQVALYEARARYIRKQIAARAARVTS